MTFQRYPGTADTIIFEGNETVAIGQFDPPENTSLVALQLFVYRQGSLNPGQFFMTISDGVKTYNSQTIVMDDISIVTDDHVIGKVRVEWPISPNVNTGTTYTLSLTTENYTPVLTGVQHDQSFFSILRDWPTEMAYTTTIGARTAAPIALHLFKGV